MSIHFWHDVLILCCSSNSLRKEEHVEFDQPCLQKCFRARHRILPLSDSWHVSYVSKDLSGLLPALSSRGGFRREAFYCLWNCGVLPLAKFIVEVLCPDENLQLLSILFAIVLLFLPPVRSFAGVCVEKLTMSRLQNIESALILVHRLTSYVEVFFDACLAIDYLYHPGEEGSMSVTRRYTDDMSRVHVVRWLPTSGLAVMTLA